MFESDNVRNVAVSGAYGAGKSSVIESYKKRHLEDKFLHISLTRFRTENNGIEEEANCLAEDDYGENFDKLNPLSLEESDCFKGQKTKGNRNDLIKFYALCNLLQT